MDITIYPNKLHGTVTAIPSKSQAHRLLIGAAFSDRPTTLLCAHTSEDIEATARCLNALGANITRRAQGYYVEPVETLPVSAVLDCGESGSTLRFLLPVVCALGVEVVFQLHGRLPYRPLSPLWEELTRMGCTLSRPSENTIATAGKLRTGNYRISGNISSQFISGLLFAAALLPGERKISILGDLESRPYVEMTQLALSTFGVESAEYTLSGSYPFKSPGTVTVEGDWSNGAFFLAANALGNQVNILNLNSDSPQGDRIAAELFKNCRNNTEVSAADIPDLVPILSVVFGANNGAKFTDIARLRLKESDRVASVCEMLRQLGVPATSTETTLTVSPGAYRSCTIDAVGDHRIAMSAAIAATIADGPVTILGADCVAKSYPTFWEEYRNLGGIYEQHIR